MIFPHKILLLVVCWLGWLVSPIWGQPAPRVDLYGDPLPPGALARLGTVRWRIETGFTAFAFSPNGQVLACAAGDHTIRLLDADSGKELRVFRGHTKRIAALTFSTDSKLLTSTSEDETLRQWNVETGQLLSEVQMGWPYLGLALSPDGHLLALHQAADTIQMLDVASGKELRHWQSPGDVWAPLAFSPDGKTLATVSLHEVTFWKVASGEPLRRIPWKGDEKANWTSHALAFSGDGQFLAVVRNYKRWPPYPELGTTRPRLFHVATAQEIELQFPRNNVGESERNTVRALKFGNDGTLYAFGTTNWRWQVATGKTMPLVPASFDCNAFSADGKTLVSSRRGSPVIELWNTTTGKKLWDRTTDSKRNVPPGHGTIPHALTFSRDGKTLVSAADDLRVWDLSTQKQIRIVKQGIKNLFSCSDGRILFTTTTPDSRRTLDLATNRAVVPAVQNAWHSLVLSTDGTVAATGHWGNDNTNQPGVVRIWDVRSGKALRHWVAHPVLGMSPGVNSYHPVEVRGLSADGKLLATTGEQQPLRIWDTTRGWPLIALPDREPTVVVTFSAEGQRIATGNKETLWLWDTRMGSRLELPHCHANAIFSQDGQLLFTGGKDGKIRIWETSTGKRAHTFQAHRTPVHALALSAAGKTLASAGGDTAILLWDLSAFWKTSPRLVSAKELESWWTALKADDATLAYQAMSQLTAQPNTVAFFQKHLDFGPNKAVEHIAQLIDQVGDKKFAMREKAQQELKTLGNAAQPYLKQTLQRQLPLETTRRLQKLLQALPAWPAHFLSGETLRTVRAVQVLERIGSVAAQALLTTLSQGTPLAPETQAARAALLRWTKIPPKK